MTAQVEDPEPPPLSVKDRLRQFENGSTPSKQPTSKPPVAPKPSVPARASPVSKGNMSTLSTSSGALNKHLSQKQSELLDAESPTSVSSAEMFRPLAPTISPQPSRPSTPASVTSSVGASATPPPLPSRKASVSSLTPESAAISKASPPSLPPRKATSLQSSPVKNLSVPSYPPLPPRKKTTDSWMEITHADVPSHQGSKRRPIDPRAKDKFERLFDAQIARAPADWTERDRIPGKVVRVIWGRAGCGQSVMANIWRDSDPDKRGSLDREAFVRGMWAVDEERRQSKKR